MRGPNTPTVRPYRVEFSAAAWSQAGRLDERSFRSVREALDALAQTIPLAALDAGADAPQSTTVRGFRVLYRLQQDRSCLEVLSIEPASHDARSR